MCVHSQDDLHDALFEKAIDSMLNQTYKDFDVAIVFDECRDETIKIANKKLKNYLQIIRSKKSGLSDAKNEGIGYINADWIAFLDADDEWLPTKIEKQVAFLSQASIISTHYWFRNLGGNPEITESCFSTEDYITHEQIVARLPYENCLCHGSILIKRNIFDKLKYNREHVGKEDWVLWQQCAENGYKFYQLPERLYVYTTNTSVER